MDSRHGVDGERELHGKAAMGSWTTRGVSGVEGGEAARVPDEAAGSSLSPTTAGGWPARGQAPWMAATASPLLCSRGWG